VTIILALPAFNEEQGLPLLLEAFKQEMEKAHYPARIAIVDDGSQDGTSEAARRSAAPLPLALLRHSPNAGLGVSIRDALRMASREAKPDDVIITMDADNTHSPALIPEMVRRIGEGYDLVIASRYRRGSRVIGLSPFRHAMCNGARIIFQSLYPILGVRDYTCGFRAYRASVIQKAFERYGDALVSERTFACMSEILLKLAKMNLKIMEVPMILRYDRKQGASKMNVRSTIVATLRMIARMRI
jgi:dolichol-phosphate mannosyltransferase